MSESCVHVVPPGTLLSGLASTCASGLAQAITSVLAQRCLGLYARGAARHPAFSGLAPACLSGPSELRLCACLANYSFSGGYVCGAC
jgi:hypothetical protein